MREEGGGRKKGRENIESVREAQIALRRETAKALFELENKHARVASLCPADGIASMYVPTGIVPSLPLWDNFTE